MKRLAIYPFYAILLVLVSCKTGKYVQENDPVTTNMEETAFPNIGTTSSDIEDTGSWETEDFVTSNTEDMSLSSAGRGSEEAQFLMSKDKKKGGWLVFGNGVLDSSVDSKTKKIIIDLDWGESKWGLGCMYDLGAPLGDKKVQNIRLKVKTKNGSGTRLYAGVATADDANLVHPRPLAFKVTKEWQEILVSISKMIPDMPNANSQVFNNKDDYEKIQSIKILFTKPSESSPKNDRISILNPELIFEE